MNREWKSLKRVALLGGVFMLGACAIKEYSDAPPFEEPQVFQGEGTVSQTEPNALRFTLRADRLYRFDCKPVGMLGCKAQLRDGVTLEPIGAPWSSGTQVPHLTFFWRQATAGDVVLDIESASEQQPGGVFTYELRETQDDAGDALDQAVLQPVTDQQTSFDGFLEHAEDVDRWRFGVPANHTLAVGCTGPTASVAPAFELIRPEGTSLTADRAAWFQSLGIRFLAVKTPGGDAIDLLVRVSGVYEAHSVPYTCTVQDVGVDDFGDTPSEATVATVPAQLSVHFNYSSDVDVLAVDLVEGHAYQLLTVSAQGTPPFYIGTTVVNAQDTQRWPKLVSNDKGATFTAPTTGRYFLALERAWDGGIWKWEVPKTFTYKITDVTP
ncbi:hypothetical protein JYJ95_05675 [Corallococcus exiguus]|uniref:hypothetical protein n=1 Tax=Corallococcus exiguus TaxID=83462 RepID=UPI001A8E6E9D|nr:hypothetical protein [Corallococcus exiguus]MBN8465991.1 hypothetical protein [Corallococcus exiguus]